MHRIGLTKICAKCRNTTLETYMVFCLEFTDVNDLPARIENGDDRKDEGGQQEEKLKKHESLNILPATFAHCDED